MLRPGFGEGGDATRPEDPAELQQYRVGIRRVMERMEAENPFHAAVGKIDVAPVEQEELRLGPIADHRYAGVELAREPKGGRRDVEEDHAASELRQKSRQPAGARA